MGQDPDLIRIQIKKWDTHPDPDGNPPAHQQSLNEILRNIKEKLLPVFICEYSHHYFSLKR
jgi:hypothetical protein